MQAVPKLSPSDRLIAMGAVHGLVAPDMLIEGERRDIFRKNHYLRETVGVRKTEGLRLALDVPSWDIEVMAAINPAIKSKDSRARTRAWLSFLRHPASMPYRVFK